MDIEVVPGNLSKLIQEMHEAVSDLGLALSWIAHGCSGNLHLVTDSQQPDWATVEERLTHVVLQLQGIIRRTAGDNTNFWTKGYEFPQKITQEIYDSFLR